MPVQEDDYLPFFLFAITFPQIPHTSALSHKYPETLAFKEADLRLFSVSLLG